MGGNAGVNTATSNDTGSGGGGHAREDSVGRDPEELFCLKWNDYQENVVSTLSELRAEEDFFDVTLACDGEQVRAHKLVLSCCSLFFRRLLRMNPAPNPVIVLWDVAYSDLVNIVDFMYNGEVKVRQANIQAFLAVAEKFRVRGLCNNETGTNSSGGQGNGSSSGRCSPVYTKTGGSISSSKSKSHISASSPSHHSSTNRAKSPSLSHNKRPASPTGHHSEHKETNNHHKRLREDRYSDHADLDHNPLTPDVSIKEESHHAALLDRDRRDRMDGRSERDHRGHRGSADYSDYIHGSDRDYDQHAMSSALLGMGMGGNNLQEFMRRAAQLGMNAAGGNMAAAFAAAAHAQATNSSSGHSTNSTTPPLTAQQLLDGQGGGGSPLASEALRRPRSVYSSQQVAQLEAYFRFNEYIDGERKRRLSQITNIPEHQIKVWFQNRRQKKKREAESDGGPLDNSGSGMGRYESLDDSMHGVEGGGGEDDDGNLDDGDGGNMNKNYPDAADYNNEEDEGGSPNHPEISQE